ncbi:MAG TPA: hypothetical protein VN181_08070, partial [Thermoanaerobaculia bacterium]|nr:hypothetical protein [Thermoanaerobaculia bacterium]
MNKRTRSVYFLLTAAAATMLLSSCHTREQKTATVNQSWPAASIKRLEVQEVTGDISVLAGPPGQITLVAHVRGGEVEPNGKK